MRATSIIRGALLPGLLLAAFTVGSQARGEEGARAASIAPLVDWEFHSVVPLGAEALQLPPADRMFVLFATAESPGFEGMRRYVQGSTRLVKDRDGEPVRYFPANVSFRVTATARRPYAETGEPPFSLKSRYALDDLLLHLVFRARVYRGLNVRTLQPNDVQLIGVPADVPYDERIYRVDFTLRDVAAEDRVVLEVLSPDGERLSKFHLELM
ncbi:MAG TPA: hypothetical protein VFA60_10230 [Terriglobales bacterium]|nr:hypothetical protein [Terriglobales bacterium]